MRILFITNHYPPSRYGGGYMQLCEEIVDGLNDRGHVVAVLTATCCDDTPFAHSYPVHRLLAIDPDWHSKRSAALQFLLDRRRRERMAQAQLRQTVRGFQPDVIFVWHYLGLPRVVLEEAEQSGDAVVVYYMADYLPERPDEYMSYWKAPPIHWAARLLKRPLATLALRMLKREGKPFSLKFENVICVSDYVRRRLVSQELISASAVVIRNGVDLSTFSLDRTEGPRPSSEGLRCLVAGRVVPDKGIHTVVEALIQSKARSERLPVKLTILGDGPADYVDHLCSKISDNDLKDAVEWQSPVPREQMPMVLAHHDVLILASEYDEPLARAMQEAMAMGMLVIGTTTGGSSELLDHQRNGLAFEAGDPQSLAAQLARAQQDPELVAQLAECGRRTVVDNFDIEQTIADVEQYLLNLGEKEADSR